LEEDFPAQGAEQVACEEDRKGATQAESAKDVACHIHIVIETIETAIV
jgi:hypothetical protein